MYAGRDQLSETVRRRYCDVETLVGTFRIQSLTDGERSDIEAWQLNDDGKIDPTRQRLVKPRWIAACLVDEDGARLYADDELELIVKYDSAVTNQLCDAIFRHNGVSDRDLEELVKNWKAATE